jgi:hypothetical protein
MSQQQRQEQQRPQLHRTALLQQLQQPHQLLLLRRPLMALRCSSCTAPTQVNDFPALLLLYLFVHCLGTATRRRLMTSNTAASQEYMVHAFLTSTLAPHLTLQAHVRSWRQQSQARPQQPALQPRLPAWTAC